MADLVLMFGLLAVCAGILLWSAFSAKGKANRAKGLALQSETNEKLRNANLNYPTQKGIVGLGVLVVGLTMAIVYMLGEAFFPYSDALWVLVLTLGLSVGGLIFGLAHAVATQAVLKGRKYDQFFLLSLLISPLICFLIVASISNPNPVAESVKTSSPNKDSDLGVAEKIEALSQMKEKGLISEDEFLAKKADLLNKF